MHSRTNRSVGNEDGDGNDISTRGAGDDAIPMINIEDAFYTRAKSFYLANKDDKEQEERLHRALGKYDEGDAFAACPSDINAWTWLFSFFQLDLSSLGTNDDAETPSYSTTTPSYLPDYNFYPPVSSGLIQFLGGIEKCTPGNCIYPRACCDVTQTGHLSCVAHYSMCPDFWCVTFFVE